MVHSTNYHNAFIEVAPDSPVERAEEPPERAAGKSIARIQFELISGNPYRFTSDDVVFRVHASRSGIPEARWKEERERFFSKGRPCMRSSPLSKRYGWGIHSDGEGRIAIYPLESDAYRRFAGDENLQHVRAMRSRRA